MAAIATVVSPDPARPDVDAIRRLGTAAESDRHAALEAVYVQWHARSRGMARGRVRSFYAKAGGGQLEELAEEGAAQGWARLAKRVLGSPLVLSEPVDRTFAAFLRRCIGSAIVDHLRRSRTGPRLVPALKQLQATLSDPAHRQWIQEAIDRQRAGLTWDDVGEIARSTGVTEAVLHRFFDERVWPAITSATVAPPARPGDDVLTRIERRDLRERLLERASQIFRARSKGHLVASAVLRVLFTRPSVKGESTLDHEMLMRELEAMGEPWKSDGCRRPHAAGFPEAAGCASCANALHQWHTRVRKRFRGDPVFQEVAAMLREDAMFREVAGRRGQEADAFTVSAGDDGEADLAEDDAP